MRPLGHIHSTRNLRGQGLHLHPGRAGNTLGLGLAFGGALAASSVPYVAFQRGHSGGFLLSSPSSIFIFQGSDSSRALGVEIKVEGARAKSTFFALECPYVRVCVRACVCVCVFCDRVLLCNPSLLETHFTGKLRLACNSQQSSCLSLPSAVIEGDPLPLLPCALLFG